jgi:hypothetical protein
VAHLDHHVGYRWSNLSAPHSSEHPIFNEGYSDLTTSWFLNLRLPTFDSHKSPEFYAQYPPAGALKGAGKNAMLHA